MITKHLLRLGVIALLAGTTGVALSPHPAHAETHYSATGRVVSFTADRGTVSIAHDAIPGVMGAMTMTFTARVVAQLAGFSAGDRVRFAFTVTDDGRRLIDSIEHAH